MATAAGIAVAPCVVTGFDLGGPAGTRWAVILGTAAVLVAVHVLAGGLVRLLAPARSCAACLGLALLAPLLLVAEPVALWLAVRLGHRFGLPVELSGVGPTVVAALVVMLVGVTVRQSWHLLVGRDPGGDAALGVVRHLLAAAGLGLALAVLDRAELADGPGWRQLLTLLVLGAVLGLKFTRLSLPGHGPLPRTAAGLVVATIGNTLKLWLVSWLSTWFDLPLSIAGFGTFVLAAVLVALVMLPTSVARRHPEDGGGPSLPGAMAEPYGWIPPGF
ncbi:hypothetical protein [Kitasatospora sp. NPDC093806]|uniref:hypothetical protein n=1 Tax=Kitasatospora sp. NPDC093806 TaxID=3155075 RepID=UPI00343A5E51